MVLPLYLLMTNFPKNSDSVDCLAHGKSIDPKSFEIQAIYSIIGENFKVMTMAHLYHFDTFKLCRIFSLTTAPKQVPVNSIRNP